MNSPLLELSKAYQESVDHVASDQVMLDHHWAMVCREVEDLIRFGLALVEGTEKTDARWRDGIRRNDPGFSLETGVELKTAFDRFESSRAKLLGLVKVIEGEGYEIDGATLLRNAVPMPFDDRVLEVPFSEGELGALAAPAGTPDPVSDADDDL
jgi:hypothetical protein